MMGWASAGEIFDPVAQALIDCDAPADVKIRVLGLLLDKLRDGDWDTWDYSLDRFRTVDVSVVKAFYANDCGNEIEGATYDPVGTIAWDQDSDEFVLRCGDHGEVQRAPGTADGHDSLVVAWPVHDKAEHGDDGQRVDRRMLCNPQAVA